MKQYFPWILGIFGFAFAVSFGIWAQNLFTQSESIHFSVNFPAGEGVEKTQTMDCCDLGGPWASLPEQVKEGYPAGGVLVWGREGCIVLDIGREGWLKRTLQPGFVNLSTHWLRNVGTQPYQIQLEMELCGFPLEWETFERHWDPANQTSTRAIDPGEVFNMDWYFTIPRPLMNQPVICQGQLEVLDAQSQLSLTKLPITIINSRAQ